MRVALSLAILVLAAGCGGDPDDGRLSENEFRTEANAICAESTRELRALPPPEDSAEGVVEYADGALPILDERRERLAGLRPPEAAEPAFERLLIQARSEIDALREVRDAARDEDHAAAAEAFRRGRIATVAFNAAALELALPECVRRPAPS